ncbi:MAG: SET domain-containing protein-lysine N-methyltransferase [Spirochaetales bacterium]|nr:SET domain-containing protein-lysine N-methyltransferase [Spirochaetales bacterium]
MKIKNIPVIVKKSPIAGKGVFATEHIKKGIRLLEYKGERREWAGFTEDDDNYVCLFSVSDDIVIDPARTGNPARFVNHSCAPNCEAILDDGRVYIESVRPIKPGEELFYDYSLQLAHKPTKADMKKYECRCGSSNCRGTMLEIPSPKKTKPAP